MLSSGLALSRIIMKSRICGWLDVVNYIRLTQAQSNWSLGLAEVQSNWTLPLTEELMLNKSCWGREDCIFFLQAVATVKFFVFLWIPITHMESTNWIMWNSKQITKEKKPRILERHVGADMGKFRAAFLVGGFRIYFLNTYVKFSRIKCFNSKRKTIYRKQGIFCEKILYVRKS